MNISNRLRQNYVFPAAGFIPFPEASDYLTYDAHAGVHKDDTPISGLNADLPGSDYESSSDSSNGTSRWRIDGATFGVQYWAVPESLFPIAPMRIDVFIPDQTCWHAELWAALDARDSTHMSDKRVAELGISRHLTRGLEIWCRKNPGFIEEYKGLPFGSSIKVPCIRADAAEMEVILVPNHRLQESMLSSEELQSMWGFEAAQMPMSIAVSELHLQRQLQKSITLVTLVTDDQTLMIFKSRTRTLSGLYHEIKVLLTIPAHPNIIKGPLYLVTTFSPLHKEHRVCGFLLEYHEAGALQEALPLRMQRGGLILRDQIRWAKEVTAALIHIQSTPGQFYSDLKMDNILLSSDGGRDTAILADFEQSRNFYTWAPPEIYYPEWVAELGNADVARSNSIDSRTKEKFSAILTRYLSSKGQSKFRTQGLKYDNPPHGWYFPWLLSSAQEKEAGEVYCLGKVLWCIFEGVGDAGNVLGRSLPIESEQRFPEFHHTPETVRELIKNCTAGAREWKDGPIGIFRRGGTVYPLGKTGANGEPEATLDETKEAIKAFWQGEMKKAATFMSAKENYDSGRARQTDLELLDYLRRPTLKEVLETLEGFATSLW